MNSPFYTVSEIAEICHGELHSLNPAIQEIRDLLIDSRRLVHPEYCLFIALVSDRNNGHKYIEELYKKGVRNFMVSEFTWVEEMHIEDRTSADQPGGLIKSIIHSSMDSLVNHFSGASFIHVPDTLNALQQLGAFHRRQFNIPVIGITGSNGKTTVKEWLFQLLNSDYRIIRSPKSYNSQIGVPLSVWKMASVHELAIFEAGISQPGEMVHLEPVISPTIGIFTNTGHAHDEHFESQRQKVEEKLKLFSHAETLIYCLDYPLIGECLKADTVYKNLKTFTWSRNSGRGGDLQIITIEKNNGKTRICASFKSENIEIAIPFADEASIENAIHCLAAELVLISTSIVNRQLSIVSRPVLPLWPPLPCGSNSGRPSTTAR